MSFVLTDWAETRRAAFEAHLYQTFPDAFPSLLQEACLYPLRTGGKRIRPLLCFAAAEALGAEWSQALTPALALELAHTFSLVHDDLPCMDNDSVRRGHPTTHVVYGYAEGLLVGDALLTEAFRLLGEDPRCSRCVADLARAIGAAGMIAGQFLDIKAVGQAMDLDALVTLHRAKTGALIRASVRMGGRMAGASPAELETLDRYGDALGLAFQIHDDYLDADQADDPNGAPNFVRLCGLDGTTALARQYAAEAEAQAARLPHPDALVALARYTVERAI